jgi:hypothetical protein
VPPKRRSSTRSHSGALPVRRRANPISVFISYSHDDAGIANALFQEIKAIDNSKFDVFLDYQKIEIGSEWKAQIQSAVHKADVFIAIYTGDQKHVFDYCGFEVGLFTAANDSRIKKPMFCIYDTKEPPAILSDLQGVQVKYDINDPQVSSPTPQWNSDDHSKNIRSVFRLLYQMYKTRFKIDLDDDTESKAQRIIKAFYDNKADEIADELPLQKRFVVIIPAAYAQAELDDLPKNCIVAAGEATFSAMGMPANLLNKNKDDSYYTNWGQFCETMQLRAGNLVPWILYVKLSILAEINPRKSPPPHVRFVGADKKTYRPILGRFRRYRSGKKHFYVQLIQAAPNTFAGKEETSIPLVGLIFAARFWFKFIEDRDEVMQKFSDSKEDDAFDLEVLLIDSYLKQILAEASEYGLADKSVLKSFLKPEYHPTMDHFFNVWQNKYGETSDLFSRRLHDRKCSKREIKEGIESFITTLKPNNEKFMQIMFDELSGKLGSILKNNHS